jgi:phosphohistidine swiveling domain-containing protein
MTELATPASEQLASEKWAKPAMTHSVEFFHTRLRQRVAEQLAASGRTWEEAVVDPALELTTGDFEAVDQALLATGYRYEMSAQISLAENPDKYRPLDKIKDTGADLKDEQGRLVVGTGANVFKIDADVVGTARLISTVETVMDMLVNGVPENTIAVIDDSGGTLTAPILEHFAGVVCMGGTVRSHLGILTREYGVPCLMDVELDGLHDGDRVLVEYTKPPADVYAASDLGARARIVKFEGEASA